MKRDLLYITIIISISIMTGVCSEVFGGPVGTMFILIVFITLFIVFFAKHFKKK